MLPASVIFFSWGALLWISKITEIKSGFLNNCSSLKTISNITDLTNVTSIGDSVDLSAFSKITEIKYSFLRECSSLKTISNITDLTNVTSIGDNFLSENKCYQHRWLFSREVHFFGVC
eukprot:TRINITY_DN1115_c0_g2_i6.p1 TRINITY_DN1115_c0_g2~~TRINITY_DN1115_c0_g2_i6.p1  ORF type:complete len:118 (+),score=5.26 TRINITY_DN1115_c0_g2_i6:91-444(+)